MELMTCTGCGEHKPIDSDGDYLQGGGNHWWVCAGCLPEVSYVNYAGRVAWK